MICAAFAKKNKKFFSSRRRHTRWNCDWSSDVCSSDLMLCKQGKSLVSYLGGNSVSIPAFVLIKDPYRFGGRDFLYFKGRPLSNREMVQVRLFLGNTLRGCA